MKYFINIKAFRGSIWYPQLLWLLWEAAIILHMFQIRKLRMSILVMAVTLQKLQIIIRNRNTTYIP